MGSKNKVVESHPVVERCCTSCGKSDLHYYGAKPRPDLIGKYQSHVDSKWYQRVAWNYAECQSCGVKQIVKRYYDLWIDK